MMMHQKKNTAGVVMCVCFLAGGTLAQAQSPANGPSGRPQVALAGEWKVQFVREAGAAPDETWEAKAIDLPQPFKLPGRLDTNNPSAFIQGAWFEREVAVPADWQGRRVVLRVGRCHYGLAVHVNGRQAGEIPGHGGELDVTELLTAGKPAALRLYAGRLGRGLAALDRVAQAAAACNLQQDPGGGYLCAPTGVFGLPEEFCLESRSPDIVIGDVWYRTSVRGGARIEPVATVWSAVARDGLVCHVRVYEPGAGAPVLEGVFPLGRVPAGESRHHLVLAAGGLKWWGILQPNLYVAQTAVVDADGKELDRCEPVRFGIREFWAQGRVLYLNDRPICPVPASAYDPAKLGDLVATGVTMVQRECPYRLQFTQDFKALATACDEQGVLFSAAGMVHHEMNLADPEVLRDYTLWAERYYARYANHPAIVVYGLGINAPGNFNDFSPAKMGRTSNLDWTNTGTTRSYLVSRRIDPTRLYYFHGGPRGGDFGSANFYPNHTPIQEVEDWPREWSEKGDRPFLTFEGLLSMFNVDYEKGGVTYVTEYAARLAGDAAYAAETDDYREYISYPRPRKGTWDLDIERYPFVDGQRAETLLRAGRAWRFYGIGFEHWAGAPGTPGPQKGQPQVLRAALDLRQPVTAWIGGPAAEFPLKDHNFYAGETVEKTLLGIFDRHGNTTWEARWELKERQSGSAAASGQVTGRMTPFSRVQIPFRFRMPEVQSPTDFELTLAVRDQVSGEPVTNDVFALTVYPRMAVEERTKARPFLVFDPEGETTAWLRLLGVKTEPWQARAASEGRVLVIGRRALRGLKAWPVTAADVEAGMRVVVFEQHCAELDKIGFRHEDRSPRQVFVRQPDHPLAAGLTAEALRDWQGHATLFSEGPMGDRIAVSTRSFRIGNRGSVASAVIETPHFGPFQTILDGEFDLSYSPLISWRHGRGEVVFCQLDLVDRVGQEPGADRVAANLVKYLRAPLEARAEKTAVCLDAAAAQAVEALGFAAAVEPKALVPDRNVLVVTGGQAELLAARRDQVRDFLKRGGELLVLHAGVALLADPLFAGRVQAAPARVQAGVITAQPHPLLKGMGPQNLHWRAAVDLVKLASDDNGFVSLLDGLAGTLAAGKGRVVFLQVDPARMADLAAAKELDPLVKELDPKTQEPKVKPLTDARMQNQRKRTLWHVNRLHSLLLANLGLRGSEALVQRVFDIKPSKPTVSVNEWVIMGPFPPPEGKWTDPLDRDDLAAAAAHRDLAYQTVNAQGGTVKWLLPTDSANGLGLDGKNDMGKIYGVKLGQVAVAVTHVWSTRAREASIGIGADWWITLHVNGARVFKTTANPWNFAINFDRKLKAPLKAGWNEIVAYVAAGGNGHIFWFEIDNPGDLVVAQQLVAPPEPPAGLPPVDDLVPDLVDPGFSLYAEPMTGAMDPYAYIPW